jgi:hypothetical protein
VALRGPGYRGAGSCRFSHAWCNSRWIARLWLFGIFLVLFLGALALGLWIGKKVVS